MKTPFLNQSSSGLLIFPIWMLRIVPAVVLVAICLAMFIFKSGNLHDACLGFAVGLMVAFVVWVWSVEAVTMKEKPQPSDVDNLSFTR